MHYNSRHRYQSARELAEDLEKLGPLSSSSTLSAKRPLLGRKRFFKRALFSGGAAVLVVLLAAYFLAPSGNQKNDSDSTSPKGGRANGAASPLAEPAHPLPALLVDRPWRMPVPLMKEDPVEPLWEHRLVGSGNYARGLQMMVQANPADTLATLIALDADPKNRWFELYIEMSPLSGSSGIFFGWKRAARDPDLRQHFFVVQLDERPAAPYKRGRLLVGTAYIDQPKGSRVQATNWFQPLPNGKGMVPLRKRHEWHPVVVRALNGKVTLKVDDGSTTTFDVGKLRAADPDLAALDARGALGVWVMGGIGNFRRATITALPSQKVGK
jgi:hypothetical protein